MKKSPVPSSLALGGAVGGLAGERCHVQRDTPLAVVQRGHFILAAAVAAVVSRENLHWKHPYHPFPHDGAVNFNQSIETGKIWKLAGFKNTIHLMVSVSMFDFLKAMLGSNNVKNNHSRGFVLLVLTTSISICDTQL